MAAGGVAWLYSIARQEFQAEFAQQFAEWAGLPERRVVVQDSMVDTMYGTVHVLVWVLDLDGDMSTAPRPAVLVQEWVHELVAHCVRLDLSSPAPASVSDPAASSFAAGGLMPMATAGAAAREGSGGDREHKEWVRLRRRLTSGVTKLRKRSWRR